MANDKATPHRKRRILKILLGLLILLIAFRIALPYIVLEQANKRLKTMPDYYGHIDDIDIALLRGAYTIKDIYIDQKDSVTKERTPFLAADALDLSVEWRALFEGRIVGEIVMERPIVRFTKEAVEPGEVAEDTVQLADLLKDFMPIEINRFEVHNGSFQFNDPTTEPNVFLKMDNIQMRAENLKTVRDEDVLLPAFVTMDADVYGGHLVLDMDLDPLAEESTFDMAAELTRADLTLFNDFFEAYAKVDIEKGYFGMYTELAANDGKFLGYVKPIIEDLKVLGPDDKDKSLPEQVWQGLVGFGAMLLTNPREDQIATRVPLEGDLSKPDVRTWYAVIDLLRNAFIQALQPEIENTINIADVNEGVGEDDRSFFQRLFKGQGPDRQELKEKRKKRREKKE